MEALEKAIGQIRQALPGLELLEQEPMEAHCSFRIGGPVRALALPSDVSSLSKICYLLKENGLAPFILGNGTNILFPDEGLKDLFIIGTQKLQKHFMLPDGAVYAESGLSLAKLSTFCQQQGLAGLEFAGGIPGTVGGGLVMNAGAYGGELKDVVESVVLYYLPEQRLYELPAQDCRFGYRHSLFQELPGCVLLSAVFRLPKGDREEIAGRMRDFNQRRRDKQPLDLPSGGSAFKRPEGHYAAALIDQAGLKGFSVGGAQVSPKHAGFVVNTGGATSRDVHQLMLQVRKRVYEHSGVALEPELILLPPDYALEDKGPKLPLHIVLPAEDENSAK